MITEIYNKMTPFFTIVFGKYIDKKESDNQTCYMPVCMCLGMSLGTAIGVAADNLSMYMSLGVSFGLCIGSIIDARNWSKNKDSSKQEHGETD